jgi:hypothetical protein
MDDKQTPRPAEPQQGSTSPAPPVSVSGSSMPTLPAPTMPLDPIPTAPPTKEVTPPVVSVIGEIAAQPEVDSSIPGIGGDKPADDGLPTLPQATPPAQADAANDTLATTGTGGMPDQPTDAKPGQQVAPTPNAIPDASQAPANPQPGADDKTIKLPVPTSVLPALAIGALILILLLAVVLYAFVV